MPSHARWLIALGSAFRAVRVVAVLAAREAIFTAHRAAGKLGSATGRAIADVLVGQRTPRPAHPVSDHVTHAHRLCRRIGWMTGVVATLGVGAVSASVPERSPGRRAGGSRTGTYERGAPRHGCSLFVQEGPRDRMRVEVDCEARTPTDTVATLAAGVLHVADGVGTYRGPDAVGGACVWTFRFGHARVSITPAASPSGARCRFPAGMDPRGVLRRVSARRPTLPGDAGYDPL